MQVDGKAYRSIWFDHAQQQLNIIDQTVLPHQLRVLSLPNVDSVCYAIRSMQVRGAPLIGATAAYGMALGLKADASPAAEQRLAEQLLATRPTAVNLHWAVQRIRGVIADQPVCERAELAFTEAHLICEEDVKTCSHIGDHGLRLIESLWQEKQPLQAQLNILTHCNAGWLATVDWGTAIAPVYKAHNAGIPVHVWVDETRPRNQGAHLTAWELAHHGVPHTVICDNTGGHLMQQGMVDLCLVGSDRTTAHGDVCNKIGTYLKALAAKDNQLPFYVALPVSTIDWQMKNGLQEIPIEQRDADEVIWVQGVDKQEEFSSVRITPAESSACNYAFDVTPSRLVTGLITEAGIVNADVAGLKQLHEQIQN